MRAAREQNGAFCERGGAIRDQSCEKRGGRPEAAFGSCLVGAGSLAVAVVLARRCGGAADLIRALRERSARTSVSRSSARRSLACLRGVAPVTRRKTAYMPRRDRNSGRCVAPAERKTRDIAGEGSATARATLGYALSVQAGRVKTDRAARSSWKFYDASRAQRWDNGNL